MVKLDHQPYVAEQFKRSIKCQYRDVMLHASIIEGILCKRMKKRTLEVANLSLKAFHSISKQEYDALEGVRKARNKLVHGIIDRAATQVEVEAWVKELYKRIIEAYNISTFLDSELFMKYGISRSPKIALKSPP